MALYWAYLLVVAKDVLLVESLDASLEIYLVSTMAWWLASYWDNLMGVWKDDELVELLGDQMAA